MTTLHLAGAVLRAAVAPAPGGSDDRIREGILVPWDEPGRTNLGHGLRVRRSFAAQLRAGAKVVGIYGHNREASVSRVVAWEDRPEGLWGRIFVNRTPLGDQLLAEIDGGARDGLSIEASDLIFDAAGDVVGGQLDFVAHVPVGAYDSARAVALAATVIPNGDPVTLPAPAAQPAPQLPGGTLGQPAPAAAPAPQGQPAPAPAPAHSSAPAPAAAPAPVLQAGVAPLDPTAAAQYLAQLQAAGYLAHVAPAAQPAPAPAPVLQAGVAGLPTHGIPAPQAPQTNGQNAAGGALGLSTVRRMAALQAAQAQGQNSAELWAALADITNTGVDLFQSPAGAIGQELWSGGEYQRRFVQLMKTQELTSWKFVGWRWVTKPVVAAYAGDKAQIPTNTVSVEPVEGEAERVAGGWDIDRKFRDFGDQAFWTGFYAAQTESYREITDQKAAAAIVAAARDITGVGNVPAGYAAAAVAQADILRAAALGGAILEDTPNVRRPADYVLMNTGDWLGLMDIAAIDLPAFLALLGVKPENFLRTDQVPAGKVIMGVQPAMTFRELGGGAPIRVEALDVARAGIDSAVYGYTGISLDRPGGVISVPLTSGA